MYRSPIILAVLVLAGCHPKVTGVLGRPTPNGTSPTPGIQTERWGRAKIRPEKAHYVNALAQTIARNRSRYEAVSAQTNVPWDVVGAIHNLECGLNFRQHLFNGDPLTGRTYHVPAGQPRTGSPPFQWEVSAIASLRFDAMHNVRWHSMEAWLWAIERYNGTGYDKYHPEVPTPYLWSWTTIYSRGKYVADGVWSPTAISDQCGAVPILKSLR